MAGLFLTRVPSPSLPGAILPSGKRLPRPGWGAQPCPVAEPAGTGSAQPRPPLTEPPHSPWARGHGTLRWKNTILEEKEVRRLGPEEVFPVVVWKNEQHQEEKAK